MPIAHDLEIISPHLKLRPQSQSIQEYFRTCKQLKDAYSYLSSNRYKACEIPLVQIYSLLQTSLKKSLECLQAMLAHSSVAIDPTDKVFATTGFELIPNDRETLLSELIWEVECLEKQYPEFLPLVGLPEYKTSLVSIRSEYLMRSLERLWQLAVSDKRMCSYVRGTSGLIAYLNFLLKMVKAEEETVQRLLRVVLANGDAKRSPTVSKSLFQGIVAKAIDQYVETGESLLGRVKRGIGKHDFADILVLLDVTFRIGNLLSENNDTIESCGVKGDELRELHSHCKATLAVFYKEFYLDVLNPNQGTNTTGLVNLSNKGLLAQIALSSNPGPTAPKTLTASGGGSAAPTQQAQAGYFFLPNDGTVHEITSGTFSLLKRLLDYRDFMTSLFAEHNELWASPQASNVLQGYFREDGQLSVSSLFVAGKPFVRFRELLPRQSDKLAKFYADTLEALIFTLDQRSKLYPKRDIGTSTVFLLNNFNYTWKNLKTPAGHEIASLLGKSVESVLEKLTDQKRQECLNLWRPFVSWLDSLAVTMKAAELQTLPPNLSADISLSKSQRQVVKDLFKSFNSQFEALITSMSRFSVPDEELKSQLATSIRAMVSAPVERFLEKYSNLNFTKHPEKHLKYDRVQTEQQLLRLFESKV